jgi:signal transduction histidine kinase
MAANVPLKRKFSRQLMFLSGLCLVIFNCVILFDWFTEDKTFIKFVDSKDPLYFNTASGFATIGLSLVFLSFNIKSVPSFLSFFVLAFFTSTISQYLFHLDLGIDRMFYNTSLNVQTLYPGRPSFISSLSLIFLSLAVLYLSKRNYSTFGLWVTGFLSVCSLVFFVTQLTGLNLGFQWSELTRISLGTSLSLALASIPIILYVSTLIKELYFDKFSLWMSSFMSIMFVALTIALTRALSLQEEYYINTFVKEDSVFAIVSIMNGLKTGTTYLNRLTQVWSTHENQPTQEWQVLSDGNSLQGFKLAGLVWITPENRLGWSRFEFPSHLVDTKNDLINQSSTVPQVTPEGQEISKVTLIPLENGVRGIVIWYPLIKDQKFEGFLVGIFDVKEILEANMPKLYKMKEVLNLSFNDKLIYSSSNDEKKTNHYVNAHSWNYLGSTWNINVSPTDDFLAEKNVLLILTWLMSGLLSAMLLGVLTYLFLKVNRTREELEKENDSKNMFLKNLSRDINVPAKQLIEDVVALKSSGLNPDQESIYRKFVSSSWQLYNILEDINVLTNLDKLKLNYTSCDVKVLLQVAVSHYLPSAEIKKIALRYTYESESPEQLIVEKNKLYQIVNKLLDNAVKFTDKGSIQISVSVERIGIQKGILIIIITDTGIGIHKDRMSQIFAQFKFLQNLTNKKYGTGIGLYVVDKLVLLLQGSIEITSEVDIETKAIIKIPIEVATSNANIEKALVAQS